MFNPKLQIWSAWTGLIAVLIFFLGMLVAGFLPPPGPDLPQDQVAAMYQQHATGIRIGFFACLFCGAFVIPLVGIISLHLERMVGVSRLVSLIQLSAGSVNMLFFLIPGLLFLITAYRPDRAPELTYMLNDAAWISLVIVWPPGAMQNIAIGVGILCDKSPIPVFPRWVAYLNFFVSLIFLPATVLAFVTSGPFAWNGIFSFWIPATGFGAWYIVMPLVCIRATKRQMQTQMA